MKTITKTLAGLLTVAAFVVAISVNAQGLKGDKDKDKKNEGGSSGGGMTGYKTGIGLRGGWEGGLTVKHFIKSDRALEGILSRGWGYRGARITGLYEIHKPFPNAGVLDWFYGIGAHVGFYDDDYYDRDCKDGGYYNKDGKWKGCRDRYMVLGIDGILGLEYQFTEIPFTIGVDIKPFIDIVGWGDHFGDGAFSIRYTFK
jgi:hypothetical protein